MKTVVSNIINQTVVTKTQMIWINVHSYTIKKYRSRWRTHTRKHSHKSMIWSANATTEKHFLYNIFEHTIFHFILTYIVIIITRSQDFLLLLLLLLSLASATMTSVAPLLHFFSSSFLFSASFSSFSFCLLPSMNIVTVFEINSSTLRTH